MQKNWYQSKAVWGALLLAGGSVLTSLAGVLNGDLSAFEAVQKSWTPVSAALGILGIRVALK